MLDLAVTAGRTDRRDDASSFGAARLVRRDHAAHGDDDGDAGPHGRSIPASRVGVNGAPLAGRRWRGDNRRMRLAGVLLLVVAGVACGGAAPSSSSSSPPGRSVTTTDEPLPTLSLPLLDGGSWSSDAARGKVLVIDVWASWCKPCRKGFPRLDALARDRPDVAVVAITIDEDPAAIRAFLAETPLAVPVAHDAAQTLTEPPLRVARLPTVLVVDTGGRIRHRLEEPIEADYDDLARLVDELRAGSHPGAQTVPSGP